MTLLRTESITKRFGGVTALNGADFELKTGEVHILLGSNGSGKSTLCKVIAGVVKPDEGRVLVREEVQEDITPKKSGERGIGVVYQELSLVPNLSAGQNILLGIESVGKSGLVKKEENRAKLESIFSLFRPLFPDNFSLNTPVYRMTPDLQQLAEIMKVLVRDPEIIILDEPTASLSKTQVELFFKLLEEIKAGGKGIIFISHKMEEIFRIGDRITVMRGGKNVGSAEIENITRDEIVRLMVGDIFQTEYRKKAVSGFTEKVVSGTDLRGRVIKGIDFSLSKGEILGLGGLHGQGQSEFLLTLFGIEPLLSGRLILNGSDVKITSPSKAMKSSLAFISGDRKKYGVFFIRPILENLLLSKVNLSRRFLFRKKNLEKAAQPVIKELELIYDTLNKPVSSLSGGNQQKVIIGRWLLNNPSVVLMDDPTKGVDVRTKKELYELIGKMCQAGASVIWNSTDDQELLQNADRVMVFREGQIIRELSGDDLNEESLYRAALGISKGDAKGRELC